MKRFGRRDGLLHGYLGNGRGRPRLDARSLGCRRRDGRLGLPRRKQRQRIDIAVWIVCSADAQMDVRLLALGLSGRPGVTDRLPFGDTVTDSDQDRLQMCQRHRPAVVGPDRDGSAVRGE